MRPAALVLGLVGGLLGIAFAAAAIVLAGMGATIDGSGGTARLGAIAFVLGTAALAGAGLAYRAPRASSALLIGTAIVGFLAVSFFWIFSGAILLTGGLLELASTRRRRQSTVGWLGGVR